MRGRDKFPKYGREQYTHYWEPDGTNPDRLRTVCGAMDRYKDDVIADSQIRLCENCDREGRKRGRS